MNRRKGENKDERNEAKGEKREKEEPKASNTVVKGFPICLIDLTNIKLVSR